MKTFEIVMIPRKQHTVLANGVREVIRIGFPISADICRHLDIVACLSQQGNQQGFSGIVVEVQPHERWVGTASWGERRGDAAFWGSFNWSVLAVCIDISSRSQSARISGGLVSQ